MHDFPAGIGKVVDGPPARAMTGSSAEELIFSAVGLSDAGVSLRSLQFSEPRTFAGEWCIRAARATIPGGTRNDPRRNV